MASQLERHAEALERIAAAQERIAQINQGIDLGTVERIADKLTAPPTFTTIPQGNDPFSHIPTPYDPFGGLEDDPAMAGTGGPGYSGNSRGRGGGAGGRRGGGFSGSGRSGRHSGNGGAVSENAGPGYANYATTTGSTGGHLANEIGAAVAGAIDRKIGPVLRGINSSLRGDHGLAFRTGDVR